MYIGVSGKKTKVPTVPNVPKSGSGFLSFTISCSAVIFVHMKQRNTITGTEAIALMRRMTREYREPFQLHHITWNNDRNETDGMRIVKRASLRSSMKSDTFPRASAELFMAYTDLDAPKNNQNRMCRKKLIRYVAFAPAYELLKVNWFTS